MLKTFTDKEKDLLATGRQQNKSHQSKCPYLVTCDAPSAMYFRLSTNEYKEIKKGAFVLIRSADPHVHHTVLSFDENFNSLSSDRLPTW